MKRGRWRARWPWWVAMAVLAVGVLVLAGGTPPSQQSEESRAQGIAEQLRCLQCAGESVGASQAPLAQQFREEIDRQVATGASDSQVIDWFVERYGDEVLLEPPTSGLGVLVWLLPALALAAAVLGLTLALRRWRRIPEEAVGEEGGEGDAHPSEVEGAEARPDGVASGGLRWRVPAVVLAVVIFGGLATWLVVWGSSDRGSGEMTGGTGTDQGEFARCQTLARTDPAEAVGCFDALLEADPDSTDALTYRGWAHIRAGDTDAGRADLLRATELDAGAADPHVFLAVAAADEGDFASAAGELEQFWAKDPSEVAVSVLTSEGLERRVFFGLMSPPTRDCWQQAAQDDDGGAIDQAFLDELGACLDGVLAATPADRDARLSRALAHLGPDSQDAGAAREILDGLVAEDPGDADALALLVSLDLDSGDLATARERLEELEALPRGAGAFLIGDATVLRAALESAT